jgi:hypothetical protein
MKAKKERKPCVTPLNVQPKEKGRPYYRRPNFENLETPTP